MNNKIKEYLTNSLFNYILNNDETIVNLDIVEYLIKQGADINYKDENGDGYANCLYWLDFYNNNLEVVNYLLEKGIEYEYLLNDEIFNQSNKSIVYLKKYHESKLLKEKLDNELKSTDIITKRGKI